MIKPLLAFVGVFVFTYLIGAFVAWEMNPADWTEIGRLVLVGSGAFFGLLGASFMAEIQDRLCVK